MHRMDSSPSGFQSTDDSTARIASMYSSPTTCQRCDVEGGIFSALGQEALKVDDATVTY